MLSTYAYVTFSLLLLVQEFVIPSPWLFKEPEKISSSSIDITATYRDDRGIEKTIKGKVLFSVVEIKHDTSIKGTLSVIFPDEARSIIADLTAESVSNVPEKIEVKEIFSLLDSSTKCPQTILKPKLRSTQFFKGTLHITPFLIPLDLKTNTSELVELICSWEKLAIRQRGHAAQLGDRINSMIAP